MQITFQNQKNVNTLIWFDRSYLCTHARKFGYDVIVSLLACTLVQTFREGLSQTLQVRTRGSLKQ